MFRVCPAPLITICDISRGKPFIHVFDHSGKSLVNAGLYADDFVRRQVGCSSALKGAHDPGQRMFFFRILRGGPEKVIYMNLAYVYNPPHGNRWFFGTIKKCAEGSGSRKEVPEEAHMYSYG